MTDIQDQKYEDIVTLPNARLQDWITEYQEEFTVINLYPASTEDLRGQAATA